MEAQRFDSLTVCIAGRVSRRKVLQMGVLTSVSVLVQNRRSTLAAECEPECAATEYCDNGFCLELGELPAGSACDGSIPCAGNLICDGTCIEPVTCQITAGESCGGGGCCPPMLCNGAGICEFPPETPVDDGNSGGGDGDGDGGSSNGGGGSDSGGGGGSESGGGSSGSGQGSSTTSIALPTTGAGHGSSGSGMMASLAAGAVLAASFGAVRLRFWRPLR